MHSSLLHVNTLKSTSTLGTLSWNEVRVLSGIGALLCLVHIS